MVTTSHAEVVAPVCQPSPVLQCQEGHWHYSPCDWNFAASPPAETLSSNRVHSGITAQLPGVQKCSPSPARVPQLHEALDGLRQHKVAWDISETPLMARCITSRGVSEPVPSPVLSRPAIHPAVRDMRIVCDSFPWEVLIHVPQSEADKVITVGLVLEAIHGVMQEDLDMEDWERNSITLKRKIHTEMCTRLSMAEPSIETKARVLKIDCLLGKTEFMGLERVEYGEDTTWLLLLGPPVK